MVKMKDNNTTSMEYVYEKIKQAIINRTLLPGVKLIESKISEQLQVSRTPIRNAFQKLSSEGFLTIVPNKGAFVINPTLKEMTQACEIRKELELMSLRKAINFIDLNDIKQMEALIEIEFVAVQKKDIMSYLESNKRFHMIIAEKSGNNFLIQFVEKILDQINVYLILYDQFYDVNLEDIRGLNEHKEIIKYIQKKDLEQVEYLLVQHLDSTLIEWKESTKNKIPQIDLWFM